MQCTLSIVINNKKNQCLPKSVQIQGYTYDIALSEFGQEDRVPAIILGIKDSVEKFRFAQMWQKLNACRH